MNLSKLTRAQSSAMVSAVTGGKDLPPLLLEQVLLRTDGVPLFVEELTKSILESGELTEGIDHYDYAGSSRPITIPATLRDSLMARLDRFMPVKEIAQIGAAIGREFSYELLAAVAPVEQAKLDDALIQLVDAGLAFRRGVPPNAVYTFKHALVRDAAYDSLLKSRRQELHGRIALAMEQDFPSLKSSEPEVLAHHCEQAGFAQKAAFYWLEAGRSAIARFAMAEAITHLRAGLGLMLALPDDAIRQAQELEFTSMLGHALMATLGFSAQESGDLFDRSRLLCERLGRPRQLASVLHGQSVYRFVRAELDQANEHATAMLSLGKQANDLKMKHDGLYMSGVLCSVMGKFAEACDYCESAIQLWDPEFRTITASPEDPYVGIRLYYYRALLCLGHVDRGRLFRSEAVSEARRLAPFSLAYALYQHWLGDWVMHGATHVDEMLRTSDEILALSQEHGFALWLAFGHIQRGWCLVMLGESVEGIELLLRGLERCRATGCGIVVPFYLALLAQAYGHLGQCEDALERLADAEGMIETTGEAWALAEVHRLRGRVLLKMNKRAAAEASLHRAIDISRRQRAKFWELRATVDLGRLWCEQGKQVRARQLLMPLHGWFTEGFDTQALQEAGALLAELPR